MSTLPIVPPFVMRLVLAYLEPLLSWFSALLYAELLKRCSDHVLVRVHAVMDFAPLERACATFHHATGPGAPPLHPVPQLVRALVFTCLVPLSLREWELRLRTDFLVRWFVGYSLFAASPDHTTLERFELWVLRHCPRLFFDEVLRQIDAAGLGERDQVQTGDTFALCANAAYEPVVRRLRHTCARLLRAVQQADPDAHARVEQQVDRTALFGPAGERHEHWLTAAERAARLDTTARAASACAAQVQAYLATPAARALPALPRERVAQWVQYLEKILADDLTRTAGPAGAPGPWAEKPHDQQGTYRIGSATDPEATNRVHSAHAQDWHWGYNVQVLNTRHFVREIQARPGCEPDAKGIVPALQAQQTHHHLQPKKFVYDAAASQGQTRAAIAQATHDQMELVAPPPASTQGTARFAPEDFTLAPDGLRLTCPAGRTSPRVYAAPRGKGRTFHFLGRDCQGCRLMQRCRGDAVKPGGLRQVIIGVHAVRVAAARSYAQTDAYKADMRLRTGSERVIAILTRYQDARSARRRGRDAADYQAKKSATGYNLKQWVKRPPLGEPESQERVPTPLPAPRKEVLRAVRPAP